MKQSMTYWATALGVLSVSISLLSFSFEYASKFWVFLIHGDKIEIVDASADGSILVRNDGYRDVAVTGYYMAASQTWLPKKFCPFDPDQDHLKILNPKHGCFHEYSDSVSKVIKFNEITSVGQENKSFKPRYVSDVSGWNITRPLNLAFFHADNMELKVIQKDHQTLDCYGYVEYLTFDSSNRLRQFFPCAAVPYTERTTK